MSATNSLSTLQASERAREEERARIAREIHDELGGNLIAIKMALAMLTRELPNDAVIAEKTTYLAGLIDHSIDSAHRLANNLRPSVLDFGLAAAIEWQVKEFRQQTGIDTTAECCLEGVDEDGDDALALSADLSMTLFRIVQESLANICKHAGASRVCVVLKITSDLIRLRVTDNGCGYRHSEARHDAPKNAMQRPNLGIRGMLERAKSIGGILKIVTADGGGTVVSVEAPLQTQCETR